MESNYKPFSLTLRRFESTQDGFPPLSGYKGVHPIFSQSSCYFILHTELWPLAPALRNGGRCGSIFTILQIPCNHIFKKPISPSSLGTATPPGTGAVSEVLSPFC
jgi:hypothetical protein